MECNGIWNETSLWCETSVLHHWIFQCKAYQGQILGPNLHILPQVIFKKNIFHQASTIGSYEPLGRNLYHNWLYSESCTEIFLNWISLGSAFMLGTDRCSVCTC
jgi:hypothetical protein